MIDFDMADTTLKYVFPAFVIIMIIEFYMARHLFDLKESFAFLTMTIVVSFITAATKAFTLGVFILVFEATKDLRLELLGYDLLVGVSVLR